VWAEATGSGSRPGPRPAPRRPAVFLDRDGVLNRVVLRDGRPASPRSLEELALEPHAAPASSALRAAGFLVFVVTNQPDLARGLLTPAVHEAIVERVRDAVAPDELVVCPHDDHDACACRKPRPGMLVRLAERWGVDLASSYMVGDSWKDMEAGRAAGCRVILIGADYNRGVPADHTVANLAEATAVIINGRSP
jgi:D-glycero-D-manno-heptose 1,7-bisphosphate phosphatase